jgi:hypothetical protein
MSNFNPSYMSTLNNVTTNFSDRTALSLPEMKKGIITAFHATNVFAPRALHQGTNSFSARFPASWTTTAAYHTVGTRLLGQTDPPKRNYRDITLDDRIVTHLFIDELDANARAIVPFQDMYAMEMGQAISQFDDQNCGVIAVLTARASATVSGADDGSIVEKNNVDTNIGALNAAIWDMKNAFDEKKVSQLGRCLALKPAQFNLMASSLNRMFYREMGQEGGSFGSRVILPGYAGFSELLMTLNLPSTNIASTPAGSRNDYSGDFTKTVASAWTHGAFGTVYSTGALPQGGGEQPAPTGQDTETQMHPIAVREVEIREAFGKLLIASLVTGHGILNPICAGEIRKP